MSVTFQYDFLVVLSATFLLGTFLQKFVLINERYRSWVDKLFPFALVYFPTAIIYAYITDELPLRCFSFDPVLDAPGSSGLGPQSVTGEGLIAAGVYIATVILNVTVWFFSLFIVIRHLIGRKKMTTPNSLQSNEAKSLFDEENH